MRRKLPPSLQTELTMTQDILLLNFTNHCLTEMPIKTCDTGRSHYFLCMAKVQKPSDTPEVISHILYGKTHAHTHAFKRTHTHKVPPAASDRLNHALIKP